MAAGSGWTRVQKATQRGFRVKVPCNASGIAYPKLKSRSSQSDRPGSRLGARPTWPLRSAGAARMAALPAHYAFARPTVGHGANAFSTRASTGPSSGTCRRMIVDISVASIQAIPSGV